MPISVMPASRNLPFWITASAAISAALGRVASIEKCCAKLSRTMRLLAPVRNDERLVVEPEAALLLQYVARRFDVAAVAVHIRQAIVLDLRHVNRGVPGGKQRRRADRGGNFRRQRMHLVAEQRTLVGIGIEVEIAAGRAQLVLHFLE